MGRPRGARSKRPRREYMRTAKGMLIASAAAGLILSGAVVARAADPKAGGDVQCFGINSCKGTGSCASAENGCAGQNSCKGHGVTKASSAEECTKKGGKVVEGMK